MNAPQTCRVIVSGDECDKPGAYRAWFYDCASCHALGWVMCTGHAACVEHAALVRTGGFEHDDEHGDPATVVEMSA